MLKQNLGIKNRLKAHVSRHALTKAVPPIGLALMLVVSLFMHQPASAAIQYRSSSSAENGAGAASITIASPGTAQAGDILVVSIGVQVTAMTSSCITPPAGWVVVKEQGSTGSLFGKTFYLLLAAPPSANYTFSLPCSGSNKATGIMAAYGGVSTTSPVNASAVQTSSATSMYSLNMSTTVSNTMLVAFYSQATSATFTAGSSMTLRAQVANSGGGSPTSKTTSGMQDAVFAGTGLTGQKLMTSSGNAEYVSAIVGLTPAPPSTLTQSAYRWFTNINSANFSTVTNNPTTGTDAIYAVINDAKYMYTTGYASSNGNDWRIEKRNLTDGSLVSGFGTGGVVDESVSPNDDRAWGIDQDASYLYVTGQDATTSSTDTRWRIEKRDKTTGALVSGFGAGGVIQLNQTTGLDIPKEVKVDGSYVYVGGFDNTGAGAWRIEKRDINSGALVSGFGSGGAVVSDYAPSNNDEIAAMVIDDTYIYAGGHDKNTGATNTEIRIEKRDKATGALVTGFGSGGAVVENPFTGNAGTVAEDAVGFKGLVLSGGALYAASSQGVTGSTDGQWRITKMDASTGSLSSAFGSGGVVNVNPGANIDNPTTIRTDGSALYVGGFDRTLDAGMSQWRIEKRDMTTGALVTAFGTNGTVTNNPSTSHDELRDMFVAGGSLYGVGYDVSPGNYQMRIEKRSTITGAAPGDDAAPKAAQDTPVASVATNDAVRLRFLLRAGTSSLDPSDQQFKLQFAERSGTCDSGFSGETYADVTTTSPIAYLDNSTLTDASAAYVNVNDPRDGANPVIVQTYEEANNFTNSIATIPVNSNGLWDAALYNKSAPDGKTFCFRVVDSAGATLSTYTSLPELSTPSSATNTQGNYRWFQNADSLSPGSVLAAQNSAGSAVVDTPFRLRQLLNTTLGTTAANQQFKLQYALRSGVCDTGFNGEVYSDFDPGPQSTGPRLTATSTTEVSAGAGTYSWSTASNVYTDDGLRSGVNSVDTSNEISSNILQVKGYGLNIPSNATIKGLEVLVDESGAGGGSSYIDVRLTKSGASSSFKSGTANLTVTTPSLYIYGSSSDLWGMSWTPADVNSATFSADIQARLLANFADGSVDAFADYVGVNVYYTVPSSSDLQFYDNAMVAGGSATSAVAGDPTPATGTTTMQSYVETTTFNALSTISQGNSGLWDFAITSSASAVNKTYCFRIVNQDGSLLNSYAQVPEITISGSTGPTLDQQMRGGQSVIDGVNNAFSW